MSSVLLQRPQIPINPSLSAVFASIEAKWKRDVLPGGHHSPAVEVWFIKLIFHVRRHAVGAER